MCIYDTNIIIYLNPISKVYINIREKSSGNQEKLVDRGWESKTLVFAASPFTTLHSSGAALRNKTKVVNFYKSWSNMKICMLFHDFDVIP
jgi:hypothetical protein